MEPMSITEEDPIEGLGVNMSIELGPVSQTQSLLTKIVKLCSEIRDIKKGNKLNDIAAKLSKSNSEDRHTGIPPPQQDTGDEDDLHGIDYGDSSPNYRNRLSCRTCMPQDSAQSPDHTLSLLTPELLRSSHTSLLSGTWIFHVFQTFNSTHLTLLSLHDLRLE